MPVTTVGSVTDNPVFDRVKRKLMLHAIAQAQMEKMQELVRREVAQFSDTGDLWDSVKTRGPYRVGAHAYAAQVYSDLEYTAAIEYGWAPRKIEPKIKGALKWGDATGIHFSKGHYIGGFSGHHMFAKAEAEMERHYAEDIAEDKARLYLGVVDAGKRSVVF